MEGLGLSRLQSLLAAAVSLSSEREPDVVLERIVDVAREVISARYAALAVWRDSQIEDFITSGLTAREILLIGDLPKGHGLLGAVLQEGAVIRIADLTGDPRSIGFPDNHPPMRSFLGVPVEYKGEILGHLYLTEKRSGEPGGPNDPSAPPPEFTQEDEWVATGLASLAAIAMKNATWADAEQRRIAQLEELDRIRRDFVAIASHELAQPATSIVGFLDTLEGSWERFDEAQRRELVSHARRQGHELIQRLETALDLSRAEEGHLSIERHEVDLSELAASAAALVHPDEQPRIKLDTVPVHYVGDGRRLLRVIHNLIGNAIKYSPGGTPVDVQVRPVDGGAEIVVRDEGVGIDATDLPRIFERYYRGNSGRPPGEARGIGLGLYLSRQIVNAHGGEITAESRGIGRGSTLRVWLPDAPET